MKKLSYLIMGLFLLTALVSCEKEKMDDGLLSKKGNKKALIEAVTVNVVSTPVSESGVVPYIIPGENRGGNRTCEEVALAFNTEFALCGDKVDYEDDFFATGFPEALNVSVDGIYVSFNIDGCLEIGGVNYKVGAVIVKGSSEANVYYYEGGATSDSHLAAPGDKSMVSNLTFCFVECEPEEEEIIIIKSYYYDGSEYRVAVSSGEMVFTEGWCEDFGMGVNDFPSTSTFEMHRAGVDEVVGMVKVEANMVTITMNDGLIIDYSQMYIGTMTDLMSNLINGCPIYYSWPLNDEDGNSQVFYL